jgi:hypothetical protein
MLVDWRRALIRQTANEVVAGNGSKKVMYLLSLFRCTNLVYTGWRSASNIFWQCSEWMYMYSKSLK